MMQDLILEKADNATLVSYLKLHDQDYMEAYKEFLEHLNITVRGQFETMFKEGNNPHTRLLLFEFCPLHFFSAQRCVEYIGMRSPCFEESPPPKQYCLIFRDVGNPIMKDLK